MEKCGQGASARQVKSCATNYIFPIMSLVTTKARREGNEINITTQLLAEQSLSL